jgi:hypothetical protein
LNTYSKIVGFNNLITNKERDVELKKSKKMERLEGRDYLLSTHCHVAAIVVQQLPSSELRKDP